MINYISFYFLIFDFLAISKFFGDVDNLTDSPKEFLANYQYRQNLRNH